jgi:glutaredoxin 3
MKVEIYGTESCTFCKQAVKLCESKSIQYEYIDVGTETSLGKLTDRMGFRPRTVPQIFVDNNYVEGGYNGLKQALTKTVVEDHDYDERR